MSPHSQEVYQAFSTIRLRKRGDNLSMKYKMTLHTQLLNFQIVPLHNLYREEQDLDFILTERLDEFR
jgi:hypothetical protein